MAFQNKNRIAYLTALTLLFSYAEMLFPRIVPFFRLGLGNITVLLAFNLSLPTFLLLIVFKAITSCLMAGTLFSPFFLISLGQSIISGLLMYFMFLVNSKTKNRLFSIYGISLAGSAISAFIQIVLSSVYLGQGTNALLGPMLFFSIFSGILTAFLSQSLHIPDETPVLIRNENPSKAKTTLIFAFIILFSVIFIFWINNIILLVVLLVLSLIAQVLCGRRILILPHFSLWLFVVISTLFVPNGKVLFSIGSFSITQGALTTGLIKSIKLSAVSALSQCAASLRPSGNSLISLILAYFSGLTSILKNTEGNFFIKVSTCLKSTVLTETSQKK